jgi:branched-chain amino acid transport system substrate-binding protein
MNFRKLHRFPILALACLIWLAGCKDSTEPALQTPTPAGFPPIEILNVGVFLPLKGEASASGESMLNGLVLAAEEINSGGGVLGRPVRLVVRDTRSEPDRAANAARDLITQDKVSALIGGLSGGSAEAAAIADEYKIPLIAPGSTMPGIQSNEPWVFRICYVDFLSGRVMAKFAESLGAVRTVVLYDPASEYAKALAVAYGKAFKRKRGQQISGEPFATGTVDFSKHLEAIRKKNPDVVYLPADPGLAAAILVQARAAGLDIPFLGTATWDSEEFLRDAGESARNCYLPGRFVPGGATEPGRMFSRKYAAKHTVPAPATAALGFDALAILANAIRTSGGTDPEGLRAALSSTIGFPGLTGGISIDPALAVSRSIPVLKVEDGQFVFLETLEP